MVKELPAGTSTYNLVLDYVDTAALFTVTTVLIFVSNSIVYYYGYSRFNGFVKRQTGGGGHKAATDAYSSLMPYCASVLTLLAVVATESPLLYNAIVVFRSSLNGVVLVCLLNSTAHVFVWIAMWSVLTLKPCWRFDLHLFLEYDPTGCGGGGGGGGAPADGADDQRVPTLVVAQGATYSLTERTAKRIVASVVERVVADYARVNASGKSIGRARGTVLVGSSGSPRTFSSRRRVVMTLCRCELLSLYVVVLKSSFLTDRRRERGEPIYAKYALVVRVGFSRRVGIDQGWQTF